MTHDIAAFKRQGERNHKEKLDKLDIHGERSEKKLVDGEIKKAMGEHDSQQHDGKKTKLKLKDGGHVDGHHGKHRPDKVSRRRRADGGHVSHEERSKGGSAEGKKGGKGTHVNVIVASPGGAGGPAAGMAPRPPMAPPMAPPGGPAPARMAPPPPAPGGAPGGPPGMPPRKHGGRTEASRTERAKGGGVHHAAQNGLGRLDKIKSYGSQHRGENIAMTDEHENKSNTDDMENKTASECRGGRM